MENLLLLLAIIGIFVFGYYVVVGFGRFLDESRKAEFKHYAKKPKQRNEKSPK